MRLHRLRLTAFGSFPGEEEVDFDALAAAGLFLIHGPTGAGKTTLLDAVCYALYGRVPGQRDNARSLRCDHAPAGRGPSVTLEATIRERRFRLTRSPAWQRPKLRGSGTVEEKAKVLVEEFTDDWIARSTRADEAGHLIGELLGMNADQFCQVAMLPQGDFARFLHAGGDDRRKLLERLFTVRVFTEIEGWLADHRVQARREWQELRQEVDAVVNRMRGAAGDDLLAEIAAEDWPDPAVDPTGWSGALLGAAEGALARAVEVGTARHATLSAARTRLENARTLADRQRRYAGALARRAELERTAEERSDLETILDEAARADRVQPLIRQAHLRAEAAANARGLAAAALDRALPLIGVAQIRDIAQTDDVAQARNVVQSHDVARSLDLAQSHDGEAAPRDGGTTRPEPTLLIALEREHRAEIARLEQLLPEEPRLGAIRTDVSEAERTLVELAKQEIRLAERLEVVPAERRDAEERVDEARMAAARIAGLRSARDTAERDLAAVRHRDAGARLLRERAAAEIDALTALLPHLVPAGTQDLIGLLAKLGRLDPIGLPLLNALPDLNGLPLTNGLLILNGTPDSDGPPHHADLLESAGVASQSVSTPNAAAVRREIERALAELERAARDELARLELLEGEEDRLTEVEAQLADARRDVEELADRESAVLAGQADVPAALAEAEERLVQARAAAARVPVLETARQRAEERLAAVVLRDALTLELEAAEQIRRASIDEAQDLRDHFQAVQRARIEGMAAELAGKLVHGEPCGVCGSIEHPSPAAPAESAPTEEDEQRARDAFDAALNARETAERQVAGLSSRLDDAAVRADGLERSRAEELLGEAEGELADTVAVAAEVPRLAAEAERLAGEVEALRQEAAEIGRMLAERRTSESELLAERERLTTRLAEALGDDGGVPERRQRIKAEAVLLGTAVEAVAQAADACVSYEVAAEAVAKLAVDLRARSRVRTSGSSGTWGTLPDDEAADVVEDASVEDTSDVVDEVSEDLVVRILGEADEELRRAQELAAQEPELTALAKRLAEEITEIERLARRTSVETAETRSRLAQLAGQELRLAALLTAACGEDASVSARLERLADEAALLSEAADAAHTATAAELEQGSAFRQAAAAAADAGFATMEDAGAAVRTEEEREAMSERLRRFAGEQAAVAELLDDPELVAASAVPPPDLAAVEADHERAEQEQAAAASARDRAQGRLDQLSDLAGELGEVSRRHGPAEDRYRLARRLAELAGGTSADNRWNMRLSSYVLGERLRQVVEAANARLDRMSGGRYSLEHDRDRVAGDRGRSGGGLGLKVLDGWTGTRRDPATLSGGESFITSLALALGLSDVVTGEAGGAEIGSLFVDEGFGTLDEDTLEDVLDILDGLRVGGRVVGIVSHVAELRTRIPARLQVIKGRSGSTLN